MKAAVLHGVAELRVEDVAKPSPKAGEVLLKIRASGVCGSDVQRVWEKGTYSFPTIVGHEFAGEIAELGEGIEKGERLLGKKAAVFPLLPCMKCEACAVGEYAVCSHYNYFGSRCDGGFAEYLAVPVWNLVPVPDTLSFEEAAMAEPAAVAIHALRQAGIEIGDTVAIFGAGPIGLMLARWASIWGAAQVLLIDIDEVKIEFARKMGFAHVHNSKNGDPVAWIKEKTNGRGADVALEGAGVSLTLEQCLACVRPFGRVVGMGNPIGEMKLSQKGYWELLRKQLTLRGTWNSSYAPLPKSDWELAIRYMANGKLNVAPFITHRLPLEKAVDALTMMRDRSEFFNKVMFILNE